MISKNNIRKIYPVLQQLLPLVLSLVFFTLILLNRSPNYLRLLSMSLRTAFGIITPITTLLLYIAFRIPGRAGNFAALGLTMCLFAMPLAGLWACGQTQTTVLNGIIPLYDAESY